MSRFRKLTQSIWHCQYHIVWVPKYRYRTFREFLSASLVANQTNIKAIFKASIGSFPFMDGLKAERHGILKGKSSERYRTKGKLSIKIWKVGLTFKADEVLSAPIDAEDFESRFVRDVHTLNVLVKEVTLGSKARSSKQIPNTQQLRRGR